MVAQPITRYRMFIDDTGNVDNAATNDVQRRFAGITGVILELDYLRETFEAGFLRLKERHFGLTGKGRPPVLHLRQMKRGAGAFKVLTDANARAKWEAACLRMYNKAEYTVITTCIDKVAFYAAYPKWQGSVYEMLVGDAIERYFYFLRYKGVGDVMAEAINKDKDNELKELYRRFYERGTDHIKAERLQKVLTSKEIKIQPKEADVQGLQMADLLASTCSSHCRRMYDNGPVYDAFAMQVADVVEEYKFYRNSKGAPNGYGRIWRPQN